MTKVIGIDPGKSGACAALSVNGKRITLAGLIDMPIRDEDRVDGVGLANWLRLFPTATIVIENVRIRPIPRKGGGVFHHKPSSATTFMRTAGQVEGIAEACMMVPPLLVDPQRWKRDAGLLGTEKNDSRALAIRLCPSAAHMLTRVKDHNRGEAILLAIYGAEMIRRERAA